MSYMTQKEKKAFKAGIISEYKKTIASKKQKPRYLGPSKVNNKFYDTNFKKPVKLTKADIRKIRKIYDPHGLLTDEDVIGCYLMDKRSKMGILL